MQAATRAAEDSASAKKKESDSKDGDDKKKSTDVKIDSKSSSSAVKDLTSNSNPSEGAIFETLKDGSSCLILQPGQRIKLNVNNLLDGGDAKNEKRKKKIEKDKKRSKKFAYSKVGWEDWPGLDTGGKGTDMGWDTEFDFKEYINEYTITLDIKLLDNIPNQGIALYQTSLIHSEENKRSGKTTFKKSDGETVISQNGGLGLLGTYGDTTKCKLEVGLWKRVVVAVKCAESPTDKGELRTWIGTEPGVILKEDIISSNERFAIDPDGLFLFSAGQSAMMPGNIAIRSVRVEPVFMTDGEVLANRARDKVIGAL